MKISVKKLLSILLAVVMVFSIFTIIPVSAEETPVPEGFPYWSEDLNESFGNSVSAWVNNFGGTNDSGSPNSDHDVLGKNASSNSQMDPGVDNDGPASWAFDGNVDNWWHSNYSGSTDENHGADGQLSVTNPIWIQTGFVDGAEETPDKRMISGINYYGRDNGRGRMRDFEIWVSDNANMNDHIVAFKATDFTYLDGEGDQPIYFPQPVAGTYVRLVITNVWKSSDGVGVGTEINDQDYVSAAEIGFFEINEDSRKAVLSTVVAEAKEKYEELKTGDCKEFFNSTKVETYNIAITALESYINDLGDSTEVDDNVYPLLNAVRSAYTDVIFNINYFTAEVKAGVGAKSVSIGTNDNACFKVGDTYYFASGTDGTKTPEITLNATSTDDEAFAFYDWNDGSKSVAYEGNSKVTLTGNSVFTAEYCGKGFNGLVNETTTQEIDDYETLMENARASSEQSQDAGYGTADGPATSAFNNKDDDWWHTRYGATSNPSEFRENNVINGIQCDDNTTYPTASKDKPIWIQTGFNKPMLLGGFNYQNRPNNSDYIGDFQVWISNEEDMSTHEVIYSGTYSGNNALQPNNAVYFAAPYEAQYIRFVITSMPSSVIAAKEIKLYEYIGEEKASDVKITLNGVEIASGSASSASGNAAYAADAVDSAYQDVVDNGFDINKYDDIRNDYSVDPQNYNPASGAIEVTVAPKEYTVTANDNGAQSTAKGQYNKPLLTDDHNYITAAGENFSYWKVQDTNDIISTDANYNYNATNSMTIEAVYNSEVTDYSAYISGVIVSKTADGYSVEIPVTLNNIMDENGVKTEIEDFGVVITSDGADVSAIESAITSGTNTGDVNIKSAKDSITPSNKGRYLHIFSLADKISNNLEVRAYYKTDSGNIGLSKAVDVTVDQF